MPLLYAPDALIISVFPFSQETPIGNTFYLKEGLYCDWESDTWQGPTTKSLFYLWYFSLQYSTGFTANGDWKLHYTNEQYYS